MIHRAGLIVCAITDVIVSSMNADSFRAGVTSTYLEGGWSTVRIFMKVECRESR
jgi:hypothetical protein